MPKEFRCPLCKTQVVTFMRPGEGVTCKACGRELTVPDDAIEVVAPPTHGVGTESRREPATTKQLSPEAERLVAIGRQLPIPTHRLYTIGGIGVAAFGGSILGGFLLLSLNYRAAGEDSRSWKYLWTGVGSTILLFSLASLIPDLPGLNRILPAAVTLGVTSHAKWTQGALIEAHQSLGGKVYSKWRAFGISLICLAAIFVVFMAVAMLLEPKP